MRATIGAFKLIVFALSSVPTLLIQIFMLTLTQGRAALVYPRYYHAFLCRLFGLKVKVRGEIAQGDNIVYCGNHVSYLDIEVVGSLLTGSFIAKKEVASWPFFGLMARLQRTLFVSRNPRDAKAETDAIIDRLNDGLPLIVFPEGTSTNGTYVHPLRSSFFEVFIGRDIRIQPFTIRVIEIDGQSANSENARDRYAWYGDMTLLPHLWNFAKGKGAVVEVIFHEPIATRSFSNRKMLSNRVFNDIAKGLDLLSAAA